MPHSRLTWLSSSSLLDIFHATAAQRLPNSSLQLINTDVLRFGLRERAAYKQLRFVQKLACSGTRDKQWPFQLGLPVLQAFLAVKEEQRFKTEAFGHFRNVTPGTVRSDPWRPMRVPAFPMSMAASPIESTAL